MGFMQGGDAFQRSDAMPGPQVKNWPQYHALRRRGLSPRVAAMTVNKRAKLKRIRRRRKRR